MRRIYLGVEKKIFSSQFPLLETWDVCRMKNRFIVIMAGGRGERFWPQSRLKRPKHLLPIVGDAPMLTQTIRRLEGLVPVERIFVITNAEQRESVLETCPDLLPERVLVSLWGGIPRLR